MTKPISSFEDAFEAAAPRPPDDASRSDKKNFAERLSRHLSTAFANALRPSFFGIKPDIDGAGQESYARTSKGVKKLDVNYSTPELGLGLGLSIKTLNYRDGGTGRYTKNYTRIDNELRAEALDYHKRQPFAVMSAVLFLPLDSVADGKGKKATAVSSFGQAVRAFRHRAGRVTPHDEPELFESMHIGLYPPDTGSGLQVRFFDVMHPPPRNRLPDEEALMSFEGLTQRIVEVYDARNKPKFDWAD